MTLHELKLIKQYLSDAVVSVELPGSGTSFSYIPSSVIDEIDSVKDDDFFGSTNISNDYTLDDVVTILSDGLADRCGFVDVDYIETEYYMAKAKLKDAGIIDPVLEEVQAMMLHMGFAITLIDEENECHALTMDKLVKGLDMCADRIMVEYQCSKIHAISQLIEKGDFYDYNNVLQYAIYGEIIYG